MSDSSIVGSMNDSSITGSRSDSSVSSGYSAKIEISFSEINVCRIRRTSTTCEQRKN